ncbi:MAG TPA: hypothetical protein VGL86_27315 [Polyangia bacterium]|jgi:hypothetical protein
MRRILVLLACLAGGCPGGNGAFSSQPSNCSPAAAVIDSIAIVDYTKGAPAAVGDIWTPGTGGQGLTMSHFDVLLHGSLLPECVQVTAMAEHAIFDGPADVIPSGDADSGRFDLLIGPVDDTYDIDVTIDGLATHVGIVGNVVSDVR